MAWRQLRSQKIVGVGDLIVSNNFDDVIATYALGSCIGVIILDPTAWVGGILHAALPNATGIEGTDFKPARYVNTGIPALFKKAYTLGARKKNMKVFLVGASRLLGSNDVFNIGLENYEASRAILRKNGVNIYGEYCDKCQSISVFLKLDRGEVIVKTQDRIFNLY